MLGISVGSRGLLLWLFIGLALQGVSYLAAPGVALVAEWDLWRSIARPPDDVAEEAEVAA
jgi:hypothetical protein